jgi:hypothetical protein
VSQLYRGGKPIVNVSLRHPGLTLYHEKDVSDAFNTSQQDRQSTFKHRHCKTKLMKLTYAVSILLYPVNSAVRITQWKGDEDYTGSRQLHIHTTGYINTNGSQHKSECQHTEEQKDNTHICIPMDTKIPMVHGDTTHICIPMDTTIPMVHGDTTHICMPMDKKIPMVHGSIQSTTYIWIPMDTKIPMVHGGTTHICIPMVTKIPMVHGIGTKHLIIRHGLQTSLKHGPNSPT